MKSRFVSTGEDELVMPVENVSLIPNQVEETDLEKSISAEKFKNWINSFNFVNKKGSLIVPVLKKDKTYDSNEDTLI